MPETSALRTGVEDRKRALIEQVALRAERQAPKGSASGAALFARQFYAHVPPRDLLSAKVDDLVGAALSAWGSLQAREVGTPKIRVYKPRAAEHGWELPHSVVEVVNDDMPFLVDSVSNELSRLGAEIHLIIHPLLGVVRHADGRLERLLEAGETPPGALRESCMVFHVSEQPAARHAAIHAALEDVLRHVRAAVGDWQAMRTRCVEAVRDLKSRKSPVSPQEVRDAVEFLEWLNDENFTFLGYREYDFVGEGDRTSVHIRKESGLGILRDPEVSLFGGLRDLSALPPHVLKLIRNPEVLRITKSNTRAHVHRAVYMDTIAVKSIDEKGVDRGERLFVGLFTSEAYSRSPRSIPLLRQKVQRALDRSGFAKDGHDRKALRHILETFPRDELIQIGEEELFEIAIGILHLQDRPRIALFVRRDPFERFVSCLVYVPRDRYDTRLRLKIVRVLEDAFRGRMRDLYTLLTDATLARLGCVVECEAGAIPDVDLEALERRLQEAGRSWTDRLQEALIEARGEERGLAALKRFEAAFPAGYLDRYGPYDAVLDITGIESALSQGDLSLNLYRPGGAEAHEVSLKTYARGLPVPLSDVLPMLENMGLQVNAERPYEIHPADLEGPVWIREFQLSTPGRTSVDLGGVREAFQHAFRLVWHGLIENDGFNQLVLLAGLQAREVTILRAYAKYLRQIRTPFSQDYMEETLARNPRIARLLVDLFLARFDPDRRDGAEQRAQQITSEIRALLDDVSNLDEDRIIRRFLNLIEVTLRTNFFQRTDAGEPKEYLSFKLDSQNVNALPLPRPHVEVFVYSPRVEAIHLRGGKVARGGIRFSDRREDFRTEVLGLMKAQMVKNAVIVPVGSKGGFVYKPTRQGAEPPSPDDVVASYKTLIRGLLDITDNLVDEKVVPPQGVVRHDGDDPYLVVAADKGTATFSDIANGLAREYGFWLDDAFASGGSVGYDHKKMGITARGAWECVKRHFREMGKDIQKEDFTVVGVGDMSGDVFGNGMLLSPHIRLFGAFNHQHVFVDPDPDPQASFAERQRLFDLPRSTWADYDKAVLSAGGGVFDRKAKAIRVTPEVRARFGIGEETVTPNDLIRAMLQADVELLWLGGIGTYVRADAETDADVGDRTNDAVRISVSEMKAKVVGEGANLGMTQRARVQFGLRGGRLNTDAIDNSGGVDTSDHEVNIKILLGAVERAGELGRARRDELLREMTEDVGELALRDNYLQSQALSVTHYMGVHLLERLGRFMRELEKQKRLDRRIEALPDDETLADRARLGLGLSRPELALLLAYSKIVLTDEIMASTLPEDPALEPDLGAYFPRALQELYPQHILRHRLRREIVTTVVANELVNRIGISFVHEAKEKTGMSAPDVVRAFVVSRGVFGLPSLWAAIEALDNRAPATVQARMLTECGRLLTHGCTWFLSHAEHPLRIRRETEAYAQGIAAFTGALEGLMAPADLRTLEATAASYEGDGVPADLARRVARLPFLAPACDNVRLSLLSGVPVPEVAALYFAVGARFGFDWLRTAAGRLPTDAVWDKLAVSALEDDLYSQQCHVTQRVLEHVRNGGAPVEAIEAWANGRRHLVTRTDQLLAELQSSGTPKFPMLAVANRQLKAMTG